MSRLWSSPTCARVADARKGGGPTSERNTSTLHFKMIRTIFFELCVSLVIILDRPIHQESTENPGKGPLSYPTAAQKSIKYRRACATVCLSGATIRSWLVTVARSRLPRSRRDAADMADGLGTKQTHATLTMSTSASECSQADGRTPLRPRLQRVAGRGSGR